MREGKIKLLITDDQILFAENLKYVIEATAHDMELAGIAHNGLEAVKMSRELRPDIILMDVRMPEMDGVEAVRIIHYSQPEIKVIMLTTFQDDEYVHYAMKYGAVGFLSKNILTQDLLASVRVVHRGARLFSREAAERMVKGKSDSSEVEEIVASLSKREKDVLALVMKKMNNDQIAGELNLAAQSVRNYIHTIYSVFNINNRMDLIKKLEKDWPYIEL